MWCDGGHNLNCKSRARSLFSRVQSKLPDDLAKRICAQVCESHPYVLEPFFGKTDQFSRLENATPIVIRAQNPFSANQSYTQMLFV